MVQIVALCAASIGALSVEIRPTDALLLLLIITRKPITVTLSKMSNSSNYTDQTMHVGPTNAAEKVFVELN